MKTLKLQISALILVLAFSTGSFLQAEEQTDKLEKKETIVIKVHEPLIRLISEHFDITEADLKVWHQEMLDFNDYASDKMDAKVHVVFEAPGFDTYLYREEMRSQQLEEWMFTDLIAEEESPALEDWMFEELVQEEEAVLEDWMFDTEYFDEPVYIADWMLDTEYFNK